MSNTNFWDVLRDNLKWIIIAILLVFGIINTTTITVWIKALTPAVKELKHEIPGHN